MLLSVYFSHLPVSLILFLSYVSISGPLINHQLPPLLVPAGQQRSVPRLHWLGVSYGVTNGLLNFWMRYGFCFFLITNNRAVAIEKNNTDFWQIRCGFQLVYLRQTVNELTAEHTGIMLKVSTCYYEAIALSSI